MKLSTPADLVREACALLAGYLPRLEEEVAEPSGEGLAAGTVGRVTAAPVPGDPPAFFAYTSIQSSARWAEALLLYAVGASERDERANGWGGSDANTARVLLEVIPKLAAGAGSEAYGLVLREMDQRLDEARAVRAIDEETRRRWRYVRGYPCPYCGCSTIRVLLDRANQPAGRVECHSHPSVGCADENGLRPAGFMGTDDRGVPVLRWNGGLVETAPDLEG